MKSDKEALESSNERIIEDIPDPAEKTDVVRIIQEKKYCDDWVTWQCLPAVREPRKREALPSKVSEL